jgi:hypothetical protein
VSAPDVPSTWIEHTTCHHREYYLDCAEYERLLLRASGCCEVCGTAAGDTRTGRLEIDHDHKLGSGWNHVRGMLCGNCNTNLAGVTLASDEATPEQRRYLESAWHISNPPARDGKKKIVVKFRLPPSMLKEALEIADARGDNLSEVLRDGFKDYIREHEHLLDDDE